MIIRAKTFKQWLNANLDKGQLSDLASHGADAGWPGLTYTSDCAQLFDKFGDEIWTLLVDTAEDMGEHPCAMIAGFGRSDMAEGSLDMFKNLMVWFAAETYARELTDA